MWPWKKKSSTKFLPAQYFFFQIRSGKYSWIVKATDYNTAMAVWFFNLPDNVRLGTTTFALRFGDHSREEYMWHTKKILEFYHYNENHQGE